MGIQHYLTSYKIHKFLSKIQINIKTIKKINNKWKHIKYA
jgi:hypothetical protein